MTVWALIVFCSGGYERVGVYLCFAIDGMNVWAFICLLQLWASLCRHVFFVCNCGYARAGLDLFFAVAGMSVWAFICLLQLWA